MFRIKILGTSAALPTLSRKPSAQVVTFNDRHYLVDCGEGTQMQLLKYKVRTARLDAIFISHLHGDHILGLPGLLTSMSVNGRQNPLKLFGPAALKTILTVLFEQTQSYLAYELEYIATEDLDPGSEIFSTDRLSVRLLPLKHRIFCRGFRFSEANKRPKFNFFRAKALEIPNVYFSLLKAGNTIQLPDGRTILPEAVLDPPDPSLSYAYCSDTAYHEPLVEHIRDVSMLYHEATFMDDLKDRAAETNHSTSKEAARMAKVANAGHLLIGHFSARYKELDSLLAEAVSVFPNTQLAVEGKTIKLSDYV
jgi:ribonuclease Z